MTKVIEPSVATLAADLRVLIGRLKRRLREQSRMDDFTNSQFAVLHRLDREGPQTVTSLARAENMKPQSMGASIAVLQEAGLVVGAPDPKDGRQTILSLTPQCRKMVRDGRAAREGWLSRAIESKLDAKEQKELARAVTLLKRIADS